MKKKKVTCKDIENMVKILKEHEVKEPYYVRLNIIDGDILLSDLANVYPTSSPFYRDSVGTEELNEDTR